MIEYSKRLHRSSQPFKAAPDDESGDALHALVKDDLLVARDELDDLLEQCRVLRWSLPSRPHNVASAYKPYRELLDSSRFWQRESDAVQGNAKQSHQNHGRALWGWTR